MSTALRSEGVDAGATSGTDFGRRQGELVMEMRVCPEDGCEETEGLWLMECATGHTWVFVNGCGHWGFITRKNEEES